MLGAVPRHGSNELTRVALEHQGYRKQEKDLFLALEVLGRFVLEKICVKYYIINARNITELRVV